MEFQTIDKNSIQFPYGSFNFLMSANAFFVLYFEEEINPENDLFIKNNFEILEELFKVKNRTFCYLPLIYEAFKAKTLQAIKSNNNWDEEEYHTIEKFILELDYKRFYNFFKTSFGILDEIKNGTLNHVGNFAAIPKPTEATAHTFLFKLANELSIVNRPDIRFSIGSNEVEQSEEELKKVQFIRKMNDLIQEMKGSGVLHLLSDYIFESIEAHLETTRINQISPLLITENGAILLPTANHLEIKMSHLTKTLYLFYLNQTNPVHLYELENYKSQILEIYKTVSYRNDLEALQNTIDELTKGNAEAVYPHISRIKTTLNKVFTKRVAPFYYISGAKNEPKQILLDKASIDNQMQ